MEITNLEKVRVLNFEDINTGDEVWFQKTIGREEMKKFEELTGNKTPLHTDFEYARKKGFEGIVVYGLLTAAYFSTLFGMFLPGERCLCLSHDLLYKNALIEGETIKIYGKVLRKVDSLKILIIQTQIFNEKDLVIIDGEAKVQII